ncbi:hypothetical protein GCU56_21835 [Geodermatophilus sabuli]|uniref:Uncharacterized protein n=1 Tax=Geodermatophilus sabuli TaxID=1564158 RepID=A0A7K3W804_9ACTN|nr:hypothetical protein [Geodermatophilus sabuli]NEK60503.1 hypothetical protein [Geodermatophilus sabuli]
MESNELHDRAAAEAELAALAATRTALADRVVQPLWYDVLLGLLVAGFVSSYATRDPFWIMGAFLVFMAGIWGLVAVYRRLTGMWVDGNRPGPTRRAIRVWAVLYAAVLAGGALAEYLLGVRGVMVVAGIVLGIGIVVISRWWARIYVAELRGQL